MSVEGPGRPRTPWWLKRRDSRPVFVHKEEAFAEYRRGVQELAAKPPADERSD